MNKRLVPLRSILIGTALIFLLLIAPDRGAFPSVVDRHMLVLARERGDDMAEWQLLTRFVRENPKDVDVWERMGILDHRNGLCKQAVYEFEQADGYGDLTDSSLVPYGDCLVETRNFQAAIDILAPQRNKNDTPAGLELLLAQTFLRLGDLKDARNTIQEWSEKEIENSNALYYLGLYQALASPADALAALQQAKALSPTYENAYRQVQTAINKGALRDNPAYLALELGRVYGNLGEWELAEYSFRVASAADPQYAEAHAWLGETQQHLGGDGSSELQIALDLDPDSILVQALYALALKRQGDAQGAVNYLVKIVAKEPDNPQWLIALGQARAMLGDLEGALADLQQATILQPANVIVWQALADFSLAYQYEVSSIGIPAAYKSVLQAPDNPHSLDLAGQAALTNGNLSESEDYFTRAIFQDPRYAPAHLHLALVLIQYQNFDAAKAELEKAASLGSSEANNLLDQLEAP